MNENIKNINEDIRSHFITLFSEGKIDEVDEILEEVLLDRSSKSYLFDGLNTKESLKESVVDTRERLNAILNDQIKEYEESLQK